MTHGNTILQQHFFDALEEAGIEATAPQLLIAASALADRLASDAVIEAMAKGHYNIDWCNPAAADDEWTRIIASTPARALYVSSMRAAVAALSAAECHPAGPTEAGGKDDP